MEVSPESNMDAASGSEQTQTGENNNNNNNNNVGKLSVVRILLLLLSSPLATLSIKVFLLIQLHNLIV